MFGGHRPTKGSHGSWATIGGVQKAVCFGIFQTFCHVRSEKRVAHNTSRSLAQGSTSPSYVNQRLYGGIYTASTVPQSTRSELSPRDMGNGTRLLRTRGKVLWMDKMLHPPKKPWNDDSPVNTNKLWFRMVSHGFKVVQDFVHPQYHCLMIGGRLDRG